MIGLHYSKNILDFDTVALFVSIDATVIKIQVSTLCTAEGLYEITSEVGCKEAAETLGLTWGSKYNGPNDFPKCFYTDDGRNHVIFNTSPKPGRTNLHPKYAAICKGTCN